MSLPEQIQKQVDQAKEIIKQHYGADAGEDQPAQTPETPDADDSSAAPAQEPVAAAPEPAAEAPAAPQAATEDENSATYMQRWRSLQGLHSTTKSQLDQAAQRIANLEHLIAQMQAPAPASASTKPAHVTDKDVENYGNDMVEFARRVTREEVAPLAQAVQSVLARIEQLQGVVPVVQNVAQVQAKNAHERFYEALTQRVSDWAVVNENPKFHDWLLSADPLSGLTRQTLLVDAHNNLDLERVVSIFQAGKQVLGLNPAAAPTPAATPSNVSKLERQVAPGRASTGSTPPQPAQKRQWTRTDIAQFYADKRNGVFRGKEAEARALEQDIFVAQREGRVVQSAA